MRLLRETKDKVASRVAQEKYKSVLEDALIKFWNYANGLIIDKVGDKFLQEVREDANHYFLNGAYSVTFFTKGEINGFGRNCKTVAIPPRVFIPTLKSLEITEEQMKTLEGYFEEVRNAKDSRDTLQVRLKRMMDSFKTYNRVTELLPELKPYIDEEIKKIGDEVPTAKKSPADSIDRGMIERLRKELSNDNK